MEDEPPKPPTHCGIHAFGESLPMMSQSCPMLPAAHSRGDGKPQLRLINKEERVCSPQDSSLPSSTHPITYTRENLLPSPEDTKSPGDKAHFTACEEVRPQHPLDRAWKQILQAELRCLQPCPTFSCNLTRDSRPETPSSTIPDS